VWTAGARAGDAPRIDDLLYRATRYGNTEEKRADKQAARGELFAMGAGGLRAVLERAHLENLMLHVLALELVSERVPANEGTPVLAEFLASEHPQTRRMAAYLLGFYPRAEVHVPELVALLDEEKQRNAALRTLGKWKEASIGPRAREFLRAERERTRIAACNALREIGGPADIPALVEALGDASLLVRNAAARAIVAHGRAAVRPLRRALSDAAGASDDVRRRQIVRLLTALDALPSRARKDLAKDPILRADLEYPGPDIWF
jgi:HEAT repeat protein